MKKIWGTQIWAFNYIFCHFLRLGSLFFLKIAYSDNLQQCLTSSRGKIHEKSFWTQVWVESVKIGSKVKFFAIFSSLSVTFSIGQNDSQEPCLITSRGKTHTKKWEPKFGPNGPKLCPVLGFLLFSSLIHQFSWKLHRMIAWKIIYIKPLKNFLGPQI